VIEVSAHPVKIKEVLEAVTFRISAEDTIKFIEGHFPFLGPVLKTE
jgi:hypothetical protein